MKIYRFFDGKLYDLEVRETPNGSIMCGKYELLKPLIKKTLKIKAEMKMLGSKAESSNVASEKLPETNREAEVPF